MLHRAGELAQVTTLWTALMLREYKTREKKTVHVQML